MPNLVRLSLPSLDNPATNPSKMKPDRIAEMAETACTRITEMRTQMGLDYGVGGTWALRSIARENTWAAMRQRACIEYKGDFRHRASLGGIFEDNKCWSMNVPGRFVTDLSAKISDDIVGSDPFFAAMPEHIDNPDKAELAKQVERKVQEEITISNFSGCSAEAIRDALAEGERCVKLTWQVSKTAYPGPATVLVDGKGEPVLTPKGDYVFKFDDAVDVLVDAKGDYVSAFDPATMLDANGQPQIPPGMTMETRLEKEPAFIMPQAPVWKLFPDLEQTIVHKNGLVADGLFCEDFIYDIFVARLEDADLMAHCYDAPMDEIESRYPGSDYKGKMKEKLDLQATGALSAAGQPQWLTGEQVRETQTRKLINIHETYMRVKVNEDDKYESWVFMVLDIVNRLPIFVEYLGKMNMKRPPFVLIRGLQSVSARAYGVGFYEKAMDKSLAIDTLFNRLVLKSSKSGSVTYYNPAAFDQTNNGVELIVGDKTLYRLRKSPDGEPWGPSNPPVGRINLNEVDEFSKELMEDLIQTLQLEFGVTSAADGSTAELNSTKTATGIRNLERTGNTIQRATENMIADDITKLLELAVDIILENMDPLEAQWIPHENKLAMLNKEEIRMLPRDVRMLLTKSDASEGIAVAQQVLAVLTQYYGYPPGLQKQLRPAFMQILKDLDRPDADSILHDPTPEEIKASSDAQASQAKIQDQFRAMLSDVGALTPYERGQILEKFGVTPSPDDQVSQAQQAQAAQENPPPPGIPQPPGQPSTQNVIPMTAPQQANNQP